MSGSDSITTARTAATTAALIILDTIVCTFFPLDLIKNFLYCADRRGQCVAYLVGQAHSRAHVGWFARDNEAAAGVTGQT